jgi:hypothetical protein
VPSRGEGLHIAISDTVVREELGRDRSMKLVLFVRNRERCGAERICSTRGTASHDGEGVLQRVYGPPNPISELFREIRRVLALAAEINPQSDGGPHGETTGSPCPADRIRCIILGLR